MTATGAFYLGSLAAPFLSTVLLIAWACWLDKRKNPRGGVK